MVHLATHGRSGAVLCPQSWHGITTRSDGNQSYTQAHCHAASKTQEHLAHDGHDQKA